MLMRALVALIFVIACGEPSTEGPSTPSGSGATTTGGSVAAAAVGDTSRATTIMNAQLAAIKDEQEPALVETFAPDAIVLVPDPRSAHAATTGMRAAIARLTPHSTLRDIKIGKLMAGANASAVWWSAECVVVADSHE